MPSRICRVSGGSRNGKLLDLPEAQGGHLQDHRGEVGAQDLGVGELRAVEEVLLVVEADRDAVTDPAAAPSSLVRRRLRDRLDRQALDLQALAVAGDPGGARVHDVADPRHRDGRLGDVGGQDHAAPAPGGEHAVLLGGAEARVERQDRRHRVEHRPQGVGHVVDLALPGEEHQDVAVAGRQALQHRLADGVDVVAGHIVGRAVADLDRVGAPAHLDDRGTAEVRGEAFDVDGRAGDDDSQVGPARQETRQVAEQEVDVEAALVGLVDDDRVVAAQVPVALQLGEQDSVGHHLDLGPLGGAVGEPDGEPHLGAELDAALLGDAGGQGAGGDAPRLGVPDHPGAAAARGQGDLGQLGGLARPGLAGDHDHLVVPQGARDLLDVGGDGELLGDGQAHGVPRFPQRDHRPGSVTFAIDCAGSNPRGRLRR